MNNSQFFLWNIFRIVITLCVLFQSPGTELDETDLVVTCELCQTRTSNLSRHMRLTHPGCGRKAHTQQGTGLVSRAHLMVMIFCENRVKQKKDFVFHKWVIVHTSDLMMIIRQSIYILSIITRGVGKLKTYSPTYCIMDNGENMLNLTHTLHKIYPTPECENQGIWAVVSKAVDTTGPNLHIGYNTLICITVARERTCSWHSCHIWRL